MEYFGLEHFMDLTEIVSADDQFLENAVEILEKELDNHELSVDRFAKELAMIAK